MKDFSYDTQFDNDNEPSLSVRSPTCRPHDVASVSHCHFQHCGNELTCNNTKKVHEGMTPRLFDAIKMTHDP